MIRPARAWPWLLVVAGLAAMVPGLLHRVDVEGSNDVLEISVAAAELATLEAGGVEFDEALVELADAGANSILVDMQTMGDYEREGRLRLLTRAELLGLLLLTGEGSLPIEGDSFILLADESDTEVLDRVRRAGTDVEVEPVVVGDQTLHRVTGIEDLARVPLGYADAQIQDLLERGFEVIARIPPTAPSVEFTIEELTRIKADAGVDRVLFSGEEAAFSTNSVRLAELASWMRGEGFTVVLIELSAATGSETYADIVGSAIRLRSVSITVEVEPRAVNDAVRAVRERNVRVLAVRPYRLLDAQARLDQLIQVVEGLRAAAPAEMQIGRAAPFASLGDRPLHVAGALLAAVGLAGAAGAMMGTRASLVFAGGMAVIGVAATVTGSNRLGDVTRLSVAILAAVLATFTAVPRERWLAITGEYLKAGVVVVVGGLTVAGLAYDDAFLVGADVFWGVKALLIAPLIIAAAVVAYETLGRPKLADTLPVLNLPVRIWHIAALGIVVGGVGFLLLRSGNSGIEIDIELVFREQIEDFFGVRPRTKEFLIGFPALLMGIALTSRWRHARWLYVVAAIGTASALDTFGHFHAPVVVSLLRTGYGVAVGYVVGIVGVVVLALLARAAARWVRLPGR